MQTGRGDKVTRLRQAKLSVSPGDVRDPESEHRPHRLLQVELRSHTGAGNTWASAQKLA